MEETNPLEIEIRNKVYTHIFLTDICYLGAFVSVVGLAAFLKLKITRNLSFVASLFRVTEENWLFEKGLSDPASFLWMFSMLLKELNFVFLFILNSMSSRVIVISLIAVSANLSSKPLQVGQVNPGGNDPDDDDPLTLAVRSMRFLSALQILFARY